MILEQTEKTREMNLSIADEAALILEDIFDGDLQAQQKALEDMQLYDDEQILNSEDALYARFMPVREAHSESE